ncbi:MULTISPECIES: hypothetical protein [Bacillaceae]|uniref:hypothetical protein n=1 Tax=Metabacillus sp. 22489 TaxID=3453928 RepID=UPI00201D8A2D
MQLFYCYRDAYPSYMRENYQQVVLKPQCQIPYQLFYRQLPQVDPSFFEESVKSMQKLLSEASLVLTKLASSKSFAQKVMTAAQASNMVEVERLIKSTGIHSTVETAFNPDGIILKLSSKIGNLECCHLSLGLRWQ